MDETRGRFAYRCLPLNVANAHGWLLLNPSPFVATWNGRPDIDAISIRPGDENAELAAQSHFGEGVLTFGMRGLFRTEPGYDLFVMGPANHLKDGIQPLAGVVETDWSVATFTMNWRFTRSRVPVAFERDEPICMLFPMPRGLVESVEPEMRDIDSDPEVARAYTEWVSSRAKFLEALKNGGPAGGGHAWQRDYFQGAGLAGAAPPTHRQRLRPKPFKT